MNAPLPSVYLLHGDDDHAISREVAAMSARLGDRATVELNVTWMEGSTFSLEELQSVAGTAPFLASRRMVVLSDGLQRIKDKATRQRFLEILENLPAATAMVIQESQPLRDDHWLIKWAVRHEERAFIRAYRLPEGGEMARWIRHYARQQGGEMSTPAAGLLSTLVGKNKRHAAGEIDKMLAYVNYQRPVEVDDVQYLYASIDEEDISQVFKMVDSLGNKDRKQALDQLHVLLRQREPLSLLGMIVRQIRLLMLARESLDRGAGPDEIREDLKLHPYVARKIISQARNFKLPTLEAHYRALLRLDLEIKTGEIDPVTALDTWIAAIQP